MSTSALADFKVWTPDANPGEVSLETVGDWGHDANHAKSGEQSYTQELEYGVANWWQTELEVEINRLPGPGSTTDYSQLTSENLFQFTERGEYWMDAGFFAEYGQSSHSPNETTFGPVLR
jgi:hypothetical protein